MTFVFDYRGIAVREATCLACSALLSDLTRGLARACHLAPEVEGETFAGVVILGNGLPFNGLCFDARG